MEQLGIEKIVTFDKHFDNKKIKVIRNYWRASFSSLLILNSELGAV
jgi:hypothetical protein